MDTTEQSQNIHEDHKSFPTRAKDAIEHTLSSGKEKIKDMAESAKDKMSCGGKNNQEETFEGSNNAEMEMSRAKGREIQTDYEDKTKPGEEQMSAGQDNSNLNERWRGYQNEPINQNRTEH